MIWALHHSSYAVVHVQCNEDAPPPERETKREREGGREMEGEREREKDTHTEETEHF